MDFSRGQLQYMFQKRYKWLNASLGIVAAVLWHGFLVCFVDMLHNKATVRMGACLYSSVSRTN